MTPAVGYAQMKDSGFPDIGNIPSAWTIMKVKHIFDVICGATPKENPENWDGNIPWIGPSDMPMTGAIGHGKRFISELGYTSCGTTLVPQNSIIISTRAPIGKICIAANSLCTNQGCKALVLRNKSINNYFFAYYLRSIIERLEVDGAGTTFKELSTSKLLNEPLIVPPIKEQSAIAAYLDARCAKIDEIIAEAKASIEDYKKWKASIIYEAVTKGLDPNVEMKDSGIEWVGEIPVRWTTIANKYVMHKEKRICEKWENQDVLSLTMNGVIVRDILNPVGKMPATFDGYQFAYSGELLMCLFDIDVTPRCVGRVLDNGVTSPAYSCFQLNSNADLGYFYYYYLMVDNTKELLHLAKNLRHSFTEEQLGMLKVPLPPIDEQSTIATYLDAQCAKIDELSTEKQSLISDLEAYKKALVYEVVTGKRRVC